MSIVKNIFEETAKLLKENDLSLDSLNPSMIEDIHKMTKSHTDNSVTNLYEQDEPIDTQGGEIIRGDDEFSDEELEKRRTYDDFSDEENREMDAEYVDMTPFTPLEIRILKTLHKNLDRSELQKLSDETPQSYGDLDKKFWDIMKLFGISESNTEENTRVSRYAKWALDNWNEEGDYNIKDPIKVPLKWYQVDREESGSQIEYKDGTAEVLGFDEDDASERGDYNFWDWGGEMETQDYGDYESYDSEITNAEFLRMDEQILKILREESGELDNRTKALISIGGIQRDKVTTPIFIKNIFNSSGHEAKSSGVEPEDGGEWNRFYTPGTNIDLNADLQRIRDRIRFEEYGEMFQQGIEGRGFAFEGMLAGLFNGQPMEAGGKEDIKIGSDYYSIKQSNPGDAWDTGSLQKGYQFAKENMLNDGFSEEEIPPTPVDLMVAGDDYIPYKTQMLHNSFVASNNTTPLKWIFAHVLDAKHIEYDVMDSDELISAILSSDCSKGTRSQQCAVGQSRKSDTGLRIKSRFVLGDPKMITFPTVSEEDIKSIIYDPEGERVEDKIRRIFRDPTKVSQYTVDYIRDNRDEFLRTVNDILPTLTVEEKKLAYNLLMEETDVFGQGLSGPIEPEEFEGTEEEWEELVDDVEDDEFVVEPEYKYDGGKTDPESGFVAPSAEVTDNICKVKGFCEAQGPITFGQLKALVEEATKKRISSDIGRGVFKSLWRIVPFFIPQVLLASVGVTITRAFNKVITPALKDTQGYKSWWGKVVLKAMDIAEGDYIPDVALGDDPLSKIFFISDGLLQMIRDKYKLKFARYVADVATAQPDNEPVPEWFVENLLRDYLNQKFLLDPPLPIKKGVTEDKEQIEESKNPFGFLSDDWKEQIINHETQLSDNEAKYKRLADDFDGMNVTIPVDIDDGEVPVIGTTDITFTIVRPDIFQGLRGDFFDRELPESDDGSPIVIRYDLVFMDVEPGSLLEELLEEDSIEGREGLDARERLMELLMGGGYDINESIMKKYFKLYGITIGRLGKIYDSRTLKEHKEEPYQPGLSPELEEGDTILIVDIDREREDGKTTYTSPSEQMRPERYVPYTVVDKETNQQWRGDKRITKPEWPFRYTLVLPNQVEEYEKSLDSGYGDYETYEKLLYPWIYEWIFANTATASKVDRLTLTEHKQEFNQRLTMGDIIRVVDVDKDSTYEQPTYDYDTGNASGNSLMTNHRREQIHGEASYPRPMKLYAVISKSLYRTKDRDYINPYWMLRPVDKDGKVESTKTTYDNRIILTEKDSWMIVNKHYSNIPGDIEAKQKEYDDSGRNIMSRRLDEHKESRLNPNLEPGDIIRVLDVDEAHARMPERWEVYKVHDVMGLGGSQEPYYQLAGETSEVVTDTTPNFASHFSTTRLTNAKYLYHGDTWIYAEVDRKTISDQDDSNLDTYNWQDDETLSKNTHDDSGRNIISRRLDEDTNTQKMLFNYWRKFGPTLEDDKLKLLGFDMKSYDERAVVWNNLKEYYGDEELTNIIQDRLEGLHDSWSYEYIVTNFKVEDVSFRPSYDITVDVLVNGDTQIPITQESGGAIDMSLWDINEEAAKEGRLGYTPMDDMYEEVRNAISEDIHEVLLKDLPVDVTLDYLDISEPGSFEDYVKFNKVEMEIITEHKDTQESKLNPELMIGDEIMVVSTEGIHDFGAPKLYKPYVVVGIKHGTTMNRELHNWTHGEDEEQTPDRWDSPEVPRSRLGFRKEFDDIPYTYYQIEPIGMTDEERTGAMLAGGGRMKPMYIFPSPSEYRGSDQWILRPGFLRGANEAGELYEDRTPHYPGSPDTFRKNHNDDKLQIPPATLVNYLDKFHRERLIKELTPSLKCIAYNCYEVWDEDLENLNPDNTREVADQYCMECGEELTDVLQELDREVVKMGFIKTGVDEFTGVPTERRRNDYPILDILEKPFPFTYNDWLENIIKEVDPKFYINYHDDVVYMEEVTETLNEQTNPINTDLFNRFLKDFWPQYRNQLYKGLYNTYHPSAYAESFNRPGGMFEDALETVADAVHEGKKLGLLDSSVDWSDMYHYELNQQYSSPTNQLERKYIDDDGIPTLNNQLEIMDNTNLDWVHAILLFDVLEEIVDEFKHYCGENGIDESGMGKCMDEFPPAADPNTLTPSRGTLKQDYYTLYNFMKELERAGVPVTDYLKDPTYPNIIKLVDTGASDYNEEGGDRNSADWENMRTQTEFEMDVPSLSWKPDRIYEEEGYIDDMVYRDEPREKHVRRMSKDLGSLEGFPIEEFKNVPPPTNESNKTEEEIGYLEDIPVDKNLVDSADAMSNHFSNFLSTKGLEYPKEELRPVMRGVKAIILKLKYHYNRPRPWQIAKEKGLELNSETLKSSSSPSYPSGHATQGRFVARYLADLYPEYRDELTQMGEDIAFSRNMAKVHYPSDSKFGKLLGDSMYDYVYQPQEELEMELDEYCPMGNPNRCEIVNYDKLPDTIHEYVDKNLYKKLKLNKGGEFNEEDNKECTKGMYYCTEDEICKPDSQKLKEQYELQTPIERKKIELTSYLFPLLDDNFVITPHPRGELEYDGKQMAIYSYDEDSFIPVSAMYDAVEGMIDQGLPQEETEIFIEIMTDWINNRITTKPELYEQITIQKVIRRKINEVVGQDDMKRLRPQYEWGPMPVK